MPRNVCITACDGQTGFLIAELLLSNEDFSSKVDSVVGLTLHPRSAKANELQKLGAKIVTHHPGRVREVAKTLKETGCDTLCLIPPTHKDKFHITMELISAAKKADIPNALLISSTGCDLADPQKQPRLREFLDTEIEFLNTKGDPNTPLGHSPCVIRAGFYAENVLLYAQQFKEEKILPLPIGKDHKFAPVALGDVAQLAAYVLIGQGKHGFDDRHRGQLMICTGPMLATGGELAEAASQALGEDLEFEDVSEAEAHRILKKQALQHDESELQYLLEYYSLVREGKTNYISTTAFHDVTGSHPQEPKDFFKIYVNEFSNGKQDAKSNKRRKVG